jgi:omega-6 fatty acid desaturase (delta-12 desaturase)
MERDMVFLPKSRTEYASIVGRLSHELTELMEETPLYTLTTLLGNQLVGWPMYLITNVTGHDCHERQIEGKGRGKQNGFFGGVNHFNPNSPLYERKDEHLIILSDIGIALAFTALYFLGKTFGWTNLLVWYGLPYLWVNHWLGKFNFLHLFSGQ